MSKSGIDTRSGLRNRSNSRPKRNGIEIGDGQRPGDDRAGARAAARPDRNALRLRPLDEIGDDQEIAGETHVDDDVELEGEALAVVLLVASGARPCAARRAGQALARPGGAAPDPRRPPRLGDGEARQDRLARQRPIGAAHRDLDAVFGRLGQIGEQLAHLGARLEPMLGRQAAAFGRRQSACPRRCRAARHAPRSRRRRRNRARWSRPAAAEAVGEIDERGLDRALCLEPVALQLDIEPGAENASARRLEPLALTAEPGPERLVERPGLKGWPLRRGPASGASLRFSARGSMSRSSATGSMASARSSRALDLADSLGSAAGRDQRALFRRPSDHEAQDALLCIADGALIWATDRRRLSREHRFKTRAEMIELFADLPEATEASVEIAMRCAYRPQTRKPILPRFSAAGRRGGRRGQELRRQAARGACGAPRSARRRARRPRGGLRASASPSSSTSSSR